MVREQPAQTFKDKPHITAGQSRGGGKYFIQTRSSNDVQTIILTAEDLEVLLSGWGLEKGG